MRTLFIDTHSDAVNIILLDGTNIIRSENIANKRHSSILVPTIKKVVQDESYDQIVVVNGPGSFTGVRLGVTVAKTLAYTLNVSIKTISYLDVMAVSDDFNNSYYGFSDGNGYFVGKYSNGKSYDYFYLNNSDYKDFCVDNLLIDNVVIDIEKCLRYLDGMDAVNPHSVKPLYVKLISVENDKKS